MATPNASIDLAGIKQRQQQTWSTGDFSAVAARINIVSELLCEAVDLHAGERVLDVATGSGNTAIAAARRFCSVVGIDFVPALLERGRERAKAERLDVEFREGDAENLAFPDGSFDVVLSTFGMMFAPDQERTAAELVRVCRSGGRIGLANWTPEGFTGEMFRTNARFVPPPVGLRSPLLWGTEQRLRELFGDAVTSFTVTRRYCNLRYHSPEHWIEFFRTNFGPTQKTYDALDPARQADFARELRDVLVRCNRSRDETLAIPGEYLEVVAERR